MESECKQSVIDWSSYSTGSMWGDAWQVIGMCWDERSSWQISEFVMDVDWQVESCKALLFEDFIQKYSICNKYFY